MKKIVIFTDGASRGNPGPAAIGAVLRDTEGKIITQISQCIGRTTNNQAEYRAIIVALEKALELGATHVELNSDSELVVRQINGIYRVKNDELKPVHRQVKQLQSRLQDFTITHIPRNRNKEADKLTKKALNSGSVLFNENRRLVIRLIQTKDEEKDKVTLNRLSTLLRKFPGQDEVKLNIEDGEKVVGIRLRDTYTYYCPELHQQLVDLVGEDGFSLERIDLK